MARYEFKLPDIGEGIAEAEIVEWHVKIGDEVEEDQQLADMMTDKATVEMESPVAGKVVELAGDVGEQIPIGSVLVVLETSAEAAEAAREMEETGDEAALGDGEVEVTEGIEEAVPSTDVEESEEPARPESDEKAKKSARPEPVEGRKAREPGSDKLSPGGGGAREKVLASPAVRARARDLGIDLTQVEPATGERLRHGDLDSYLLYHGGAATQAPARRMEDEDVKVVGLRRRISDNMQEAKRRIPHFTYVDEVDMTALEATRAMMNADRGDNPKLTVLPFLVIAMCRVLPDYPQINATYDDEAGVVHRSGAVHMGIATQTDNGLMVPVIRNAEKRDVWNLAGEIARLAEAARAGKAGRDELSGSTITISSLGPMGGIVSTPVINRPEVAIIAVNKIKEMPVVKEGELDIAKMMNLSLSCDHRVVDGWDAASFIQDLRAVLENPLRLLSMR
ncbi:MAG: dihydrolipoamide acetyltransferase family protein [Sphingomonadaceae bacterium]